MEKVKVFFTAIGTAIVAWFGYIAIPFLFLVALNIADYATGYTAAPYRGQERKSKIGFRGIAKKVCMWLLVGIGGVMDWLLMYAMATMGIQSPFKFVLSSAVAIWLICNEIISILENVGDIGVPLPPFLMRAVEWVKSGVEAKEEVHEDMH